MANASDNAPKSLVYKRDTFKTLEDILVEDGVYQKDGPGPSLLPSSVPPDIPPSPIALKRQEATSRPLPGIKVRRREHTVLIKDEWLKADVLPGWRVIDLMVDIIVIMVIVFPWPWWAALCVVLGVRVPTVNRHLK